MIKNQANDSINNNVCVFNGGNALQLAAELAKHTGFLRHQVVSEELKETSADSANPIIDFFKAFKQYLIPDLTEEIFADLYSQTITYGLFAARTRCRSKFSRKNAIQYIPQTIGILHNVFEYISLGNITEQLARIIDDMMKKGPGKKISQKGNLFLGFGDYDAALTQYQQSLEIREKIGDIAGMAESMGQIGALYLKQNQCETAMKLLVQSFAIFTKIGSPNANFVKRNIARCREKMTEEKFKAILEDLSAEC